jgi:predicted enzyme related to lactoylglutathione lyase
MVFISRPRDRGVEFVQAPEERPYGIDAAFRDPSGNNIRITESQETTSS